MRLPYAPESVKESPREPRGRCFVSKHGSFGEIFQQIPEHTAIVKGIGVGPLVLALYIDKLSVSFWITCKVRIRSKSNAYSWADSFLKTSISATFGKCRYVYYGRHSEGNRFIRNNDL